MDPYTSELHASASAKLIMLTQFFPLIIVVDSVLVSPCHISLGTKVLLVDCNETSSVDSVYAEWIIL